MKRSILSIGLAVATLALLGALVLQSRPISVDVHVAHHAAIAELERAAEDFTALVVSLNSSWSNVQVPDEGTRALADRVSTSPARLTAQLFQVRGGTSQETRVLNRYEGYSSLVGHTEILVADLPWNR